MEPDTTHYCWHGPYSAFNRWRQQLADLLGYPKEDNPYGHCALPARYLDTS